MAYKEQSDARLATLFDKEPLILGIDTSCDDTSVAILSGSSRILSLCTNSQTEIHGEFGGIVPEIASRNHTKNIAPVAMNALATAGCTISDISAIAVTSAPGLLGALLAGLSFAKGLAYSLDIPFVGVNHIAGHISANFLTYPELEPPFICLVASGGHSQIVYVSDYTRFEVLGGTCDDAAGEALDKIARELSLPYPGGPNLEQLAKTGDEKAFSFKSRFNTTAEHTQFSFSGIKTAVINTLQTAKKDGTDISLADIAASFQRAVVETLVFKTILCAKNKGAKKIAIAGGVSANKRLRNMFRDTAKYYGFDFYCPAMEYCTDNAAMIACAGYHMLKNGQHSPLSIDARASGDINKLFD